MKYITLGLIILITLFLRIETVWASNTPIVVNTNEHYTVSIFFPDQIKSVVAPAAHFSFVHEKNGTLGTLTGQKGIASNLTVITAKGLIFSFEVNYSDSVANFTYVLSAEDAAASLSDAPKQAVIDTAVVVKDTPVQNTTQNTQIAETNSTGGEGTFYEMDREGYYSIFCENNYMQKPQLKDKHTAIGGIGLTVKSVVKDRNEVYITLAIDNAMQTVVMLKAPQFYVKTKGSDQLEMKPLYTFNFKKEVVAGEENSFVFVFKDFRLGAGQQVFVVVDTQDGKKKLVLPLENSLF